MNSKLRETLETLYGNIDQGVLQTEVYLDQAEKTIRQAVGEEMLEHLQSTFRRDNCPASCDGYGTYATADEQGDPEPNQCQWCYEERLPYLSELRQKIKEWSQGDS